MQPALDQLFRMLNNLDQKVQAEIRKGKVADGCTIAALLLMNAAMLHQRIVYGRWLHQRQQTWNSIKNDVNVVRRM